MSGFRIHEDRLELTDRSKTMVFPFDHINWFRSTGNYVKIVSTGRPFLFKATTQELENQLPFSEFLRVHKSFIVNRRKVTRYNLLVVEVMRQPIPVGKTFIHYVQRNLGVRPLYLPSERSAPGVSSGCDEFSLQRM